MSASSLLAGLLLARPDRHPGPGHRLAGPLQVGLLCRLLSRLRGCVEPLPRVGSGDITVGGTFRIGGGQHPVEIPLTVTVSGDQIDVEGQFDVPYVDWGLEDPSKFVLRVAKQVTVAITARATITADDDAGAK